MSGLHYKYVLIGGGVASSAAAVSIREVDKQGAMLLVGQEINRPYDRSPLSKAFLKHTVRHDELFTLPDDWLRGNDVQLRTGRRAGRIDVSRHALMLDNGEEVAFDRLLIATGGAAAPLDIPGAALPNIFYLRSLDDANRLQHAIDKARHEGLRHERGRGKVTVIGAGWLGTELAATLTEIGLHVDLVGEGEHPLAGAVGEVTGKFVERYLASHGVSTHMHARPLRFEGDGRVQHVALTNGATIDTDFAVPAVGLIVNKDLLRGTAIAAEKAILTDVHACTNVPDIYAAGDCAAIFDPLFGKHRHLGHAEHARVTGALAGRNMAGMNEAYDAVNFVNSEVFGVPIRIWGEARFVHHRIIRGTPNPDAPSFVEIGVADDGRVSQVVAIGSAGQDPALPVLVHTRKRINGDEERLKDPSIGL